MFKPVTKVLFILSIPLLLGQSCSLVPSNQRIDGGVWLSQDQGVSWKHKVFVKKEEDSVTTIANLDIYALEFHPIDSRILYASTNKGVFVTENNGDSWREILPNSQITDFALDPDTVSVVYAAFSNRIMKTLNQGEQWEQIYIESRPGVTITQVEVDHTDRNRVYMGMSSGDLLLSNDAGISWQTVTNLKDRITKILISPRDSREIYIATQTKGIWISIDKAATWDNLIEQYQQFSEANQYTMLIYDESRDGSLLYASAYGLLWTHDLGLTWEQVPLITPPKSVEITALALDPDNPDMIYYSAGSVFYKTFDNGANWITQNLPSSRQASVLLVDFFDPNNVYLGVKQRSKKKSRFGF